ncbi:MAG: hypothetical protein ACE37H_07450 [Phycisphaeraceae bacterium]
MKPSVAHLARLFEMLWYLFMGLFLGLAGGLVLAVILTFRRTREMQASPGVEPYSDPMFAEHHHDAVAGAIGQDLFMVGGTAAAVLLGLAVVARLANGAAMMVQHQGVAGSKSISALRWLALMACVVLMLTVASITLNINTSWPGLYDTSASEPTLADRREAFDNAHNRSERVATAAWLCGLLAFAVSPWCLRPADVSNAEQK